VDSGLFLAARVGQQGVDFASIWRWGGLLDRESRFGELVNVGSALPVNGRVF
jgi:hypothetical protein